MTTTVATSGQDVIYKRLYKRADGLKIQIRIRSNPYKFQCSAVAEVWHEPSLSWNHIGQIETGAMKTEEGLTYLPRNTGVDKKHFIDDDATLVKMVNEVLG